MILLDDDLLELFVLPGQELVLSRVFLFLEQQLTHLIEFSVLLGKGLLDDTVICQLVLSIGQPPPDGVNVVLSSQGGGLILVEKFD